MSNKSKFIIKKTFLLLIAFLSLFFFYTVYSQNKASTQIQSRLAKEVTSQNVLKEYPRPQMVRGNRENVKPNIILILADDLGYADLGHTGCKDFKTPHIDKLASNGVVCTNGYASHSFCAPTRAGIMAGRNQHRFGSQENPSVKFDDLGLPKDQYTLPQLLSKGGYKSSIVGKWHLGTKEEHHPLNRGFDDFFGFLSGGHDYFSSNTEETNKHSYTQPLEFNGKKVSVDGYLTDQLTSYGVNFIKEKREAPFFLYMSYNAPHSPFQAPKKYLDRVKNIKDSKRQTYAAMITALDDGVGEIMKALEEKGIEENTLVFFLSDNGGAPNAPALNTPFKGMKGTLLEGGIHVPFIVYWKGKLAPMKYEKPVVSYDVFKTALEVADVKFPDDREMDSRNLLPYLQGKDKTAPHDYIYWKQANYQWAIRTENNKVLGLQDQKPYLFDMNDEQLENIDRSSSKSFVYKNMIETYQNWKSKMPKAKYESTGIAVKKQSEVLKKLEETRIK